MGYFVDTVAAYLAGQMVRAAWLVEFDFTSETMRLWQGFGDIVAGGETWSGLGELGSISGLESPVNGNAPNVTFTLSGVSPDIVSKAVNSSAEVKGRPVTIFIQFFDASWQVLDAPYAIFAGVMDSMKGSMDGPSTRTISLTAEGLWTRRIVVPWGYLNASSQRGRYPGDAGCDMVQQITNISTGWPWL